MLTLLAGLKFLLEQNKSMSNKLSEKKKYLEHLEQQKGHLESQLENALSQIEVEKACRHNEASQ